MLRGTSFLLLLLLPTFGFGQNPWMNELHYDNTGADLNEGVEIAGPAGLNLACYDVIAYNGAGGASYITLTLSGIIPDEGCGYGAIWFPISGLQNGAPDGIALHNTCTNTLIEFLSYEGTFVATDGAANGTGSTDIGVAETGTTLIGQSLQLTGSGNNSGAFAWTGPSASSQGSLNVGQTISPCGSNTVTTGAVTGGPFTVDCTNSVTDAGSVSFTSTGTFNAANIYSVQLSDASGSFASPLVIGSINSTANSGTINFTIPAGTNTGVGYLIRVVSDDPTVIGSTSPSAVLITQVDPCVPSISTGVIINEWSNGPSGNQEYYEFVVAGQCGTLADIRGYILDDNNGTFTNPADYTGSPSGIAPGHFRFSNAAQWASLPVGSLIVIYNNGDPNPDLPADDPTDANNDSLYVIPHDNPLFERCTSLPGVSSPDSIYTPCTYAVAPIGGWSPLSLRNDGDAIQVRNPDGSYYHGVSYGGSEITGGPNNLKLINGSGGGMVGWFSSGDFFDVSNWSSGSTTGNQTPGLPNNAANATWLQLMRNPSAANCPVTVLPVELRDFHGKKLGDANFLHWQTLTESNSSYFMVERSIDLIQWDLVGIESAAGNSEEVITYSLFDRDFKLGKMNYYRLTQVDLDGTEEVFGKIVTLNNESSAVKLSRIVNLLGQEMDAETRGVQIHIYSDGTSKKIFKN